jgi:hypothetical protein
MAWLVRGEVFDPAEVSVFHCINRRVRRGFLCGAAFCAAARPAMLVDKHRFGGASPAGGVAIQEQSWGKLGRG